MAHASLSASLTGVFNQFGVPYHVWTMVASERLSTVQDFKTRWKDVTAIEAEAPGKWQFRVGDPGFDSIGSQHTRIRVIQAWEECVRIHARQVRLTHGVDEVTPGCGPHTLDVMQLAFDRDALREAYARQNGWGKASS